MTPEFVLGIIVALKVLKMEYNGGMNEWETLPYFYILLNHVSFNLFISFLNSHKSGQVSV